MPETYADRINAEIIRFFDDYFPRKFIRHVPMYRHTPFAYYHNFHTVGVSLIIFLPLFKDEKDELNIQSKRHIRVVLRKGEPPYLIELKDTMLINSWRDRLQERVSILLEFMNTQMYVCKKCDVYMIPKTRKTRRDRKRTQVVTLQCPQCHKYKSTEYGMRLKTILHRNLKKTRVDNEK